MERSPQQFDSTVPGTSLDAYIQSANTVAMLTAEQERELTLEFREHQNLDAARKLVTSHMRFVVYIARSYSGYGLPVADLIQEGNVGLMKAVQRFDPDYGVRLVSFAVHWIRAEIHEYILRNWRIVKIATTKAQRRLFFNLRSSKKRLGWMSQQEVSDVAETLGVDPNLVRQMEGRLSQLDEPFDGTDDDDDENNTAPARVLFAPASDPAQIVEQDNAKASDLAKLHQALDSLEPRSADIIRRRWLTDTKSTLHQLAKEYEVSAERIRQLEKRALRKLHTLLHETMAERH